MSSIAQSKQALEAAINSIFPKLMADYRSIPQSISRERGIEGNVKDTCISVSDTLAYLIGWGNLVLKWYRLTSLKLPVDFPETGFKWNQLGLLAEHFHREYAQWQYDELLEEYEKVVYAVLNLISERSHQELYEMPWYNQWTLGRMIQLNTVSPMKNIRKKVRRFKKQRCAIKVS